MIPKSRRRRTIAVLGALVLAIQLVRAPTVTIGIVAVFVATWWLRRNRRRYLVRASSRRARREVITVALITAACWLGCALLLTAWELSMHPVQIGQEETEAIFQYWPWAFMLDGFAADFGVSYLMLALAETRTGPSRRRKRRTPELATVKVESDPQ